MLTNSDKIRHEINREEIVQFGRSIIAIPSPRFKETQLARYLANYLKILGLEVQLMPLQKTGWNTHQVVARLKGSQPGPRILLHAHMDTGSGQYEGLLYREEEWTRDPFAGELDGGYLYGLGTHNNKNGLISSVQAINALTKSKVEPAGEVILAFVALETAGGIGSQYLVDQGLEFDYAVVTEGTGLNIVTVSVGNFRASLIIDGEHEHHSAHASPIDVASSLLNRMTPSYASMPPDSWLPFEPDLNFPGYPRAAVRRIETDLDQCILYIDIATIPSQTANDVLLAVHKLARELEEFYPSVRITVDPSKWISPYIENNLCGGHETPHDSPLVQTFRKTHYEILGEHPKIGTAGRLGAAADSSIFRRIGIPTIEYGPGSIEKDLERWPTADERVRVDDLVNCTEVIALAVAKLCGVSD